QPERQPDSMALPRWLSMEIFGPHPSPRARSPLRIRVLEEAADRIAGALQPVGWGGRLRSRLPRRQPLARETAVADLGQDLFHRRAHRGAYHARAASAVAEARGSTDAPAHSLHPVPLEQLRGEPELLDALQVRHPLRIAGVDQGLEGGAGERVHAAAEDRLLSEQIDLYFVAHGGLEQTGAGASDGGAVRARSHVSLAGSVAMDRIEG